MTSSVFVFLLMGLIVQVYPTKAQDYEVADIDCSMEPGRLYARLRRPEGFRGSPLFADQRDVNPLMHPHCQIRPDASDTTGRVYILHVTDLPKCGVLKRNGFLNLRVWFPQLPGVVMVADQEVIIMCRPPTSTVVETRSAGFASSMASGARVSGVVEESPGRLEYEVALFRETSARSTNGGDTNELPLDQAVPIGTKLQLRARINSKSAWKFAKLMEVTVSPDPDNAHAPGHVSLVRNGCRNQDLTSIIPHQPARYRERHHEVYLDFEAFLLSGLAERSTLWIHSQIKACMEPTDCHPEFCMDNYQPSGHGRRRRSNTASPAVMEPWTRASHSRGTQGTPDDSSTKFGENLGYTVIMPQEYYHRSSALEASCRWVTSVAAALGAVTLLSGLLAGFLAARLRNANRGRRKGTVCGTSSSASLDCKAENLKISRNRYERDSSVLRP